MNKPSNQENFLDVKAIISGTLVTLALMFVFISFAAAVGLWNYQPDELHPLDGHLWILTAIAWTTSVLLGSIWTTMITETSKMKIAFFNSGTMWAASYLLFGGVSRSITDISIVSIFDPIPQKFFLHGFAGDVSSLFASFIGAAIGVYLVMAVAHSRILKRRQDPVWLQA